MELERSSNGSLQYSNEENQLGADSRQQSYAALGINPGSQRQAYRNFVGEALNHNDGTIPGLQVRQASFNSPETRVQERDRYIRYNFGQGDQTVARAQASLALAGYDLGNYGYKGVDGELGPKTTKAVMDFQTAAGLKSTGKLDQETIRTLDLATAKGLKKADIEELGKKAKNLGELPNPSLGKELNINNPETYRNYSLGHNPGSQNDHFKKFMDETGHNIKPTASHVCERDKYVRYNFGQGDQTVAKVQASLAVAGYDIGNTGYKGVDGEYGPKTAKVIIDFQTAVGLKPTGKVDQETLRGLERVTEVGLTKVDIEKLREKNENNEILNSNHLQGKLKNASSNFIVNSENAIKNIDISNPNYKITANGNQLGIKTKDKEFIYDLNEMKSDFRKLAELQDKNEKNIREFAKEIKEKYKEFFNALNVGKDNVKLIAIRDWGEGKMPDNFKRVGEHSYDDMFLIIDKKGNINVFDEVNLEGSEAKGYFSIHGNKVYKDGINPVIKDGVYAINTVLHSGYRALTINNDNRVPTLGTNPNHPERDSSPTGPYATGVHIHKGGNDWNWSEGCLTVHQSKWDRFIKNFPKDSKVGTEVGKLIIVSF